MNYESGEIRKTGEINTYQTKKKSREVKAIKYMREDNIHQCMDLCPEINYNSEENEYYLNGRMLIKNKSFIVVQGDCVGWFHYDDDAFWFAFED